MFDQVLVKNTARTRRPVAVALSFGVQVLVVGGTILLPLLHTEAITGGRIPHIFTAPLADHSERIISEHTAVPAARRSGPAPRVFTDPTFRAPARVPDVILGGDNAPADVLAGTAGPVIPGALNGVPGGIGYEMPSLPKPAPPVAAPPKASVPPKPVVVGGDVQAAKLIRQVTPVYPTLAKQARVSGTVHLEAIIDRNGAIESLRVKSGSGLLAPAAVDAVRQWLYRPTLLNGVPVEVLTEIEVNFRLSQ
ncbi:MAG: TonB family protein [Bryobacterales bacterium]|nr:TonB family protein [Bryobacterales bacterium]